MNKFNKNPEIMKNRYEALIVLNTQGKEDTVKDIVDRLESEFQKEGAESRAGPEDGQAAVFLLRPASSTPGFFVNFIFHADSQLITKLRSKFKLDPEVYRQHYQKLRREKEKRRREKESRPRSSFARTAAWPASTKSFSSGT